MDEAEASWDEALRLDPRVPEAGWCLLEVYYLQNRPGDARRLALRLHEVEPDPRDRVQLLLELVRQDAQPMDPGSVVQWFEPVVRQNPTDLHASLALGLFLVRASQVDRGLDVLRGAVRRHPKSPDAWDAWLTGLDDAGQLDLMEQSVSRLPPRSPIWTASPGTGPGSPRSAPTGRPPPATTGAPGWPNPTTPGSGIV